MTGSSSLQRVPSFVSLEKQNPARPASMSTGHVDRDLSNNTHTSVSTTPSSSCLSAVLWFKISVMNQPILKMYSRHIYPVRATVNWLGVLWHGVNWSATCMHGRIAVRSARQCSAEISGEPCGTDSNNLSGVLFVLPVHQKTNKSPKPTITLSK